LAGSSTKWSTEIARVPNSFVVRVRTLTWLGPMWLGQWGY
jgi:hypothetical protein